MRLSHVIMAIGLAMGGVSPMHAASLPETEVVTLPSNEKIGLSVSRIDYRQDLTRVYCRLSATPHTSHRIDSVSIESGGKTYTATDVDGVDFKRYFQTEDEGFVDLEIDFAPVRRSDNMMLSFVTPRGVCRFKISGK